MNKRLTSFLLTAVVAAGLFGCESTQKTETTTTQPAEQEVRTTRSGWPRGSGGNYAWSSMAYPTGDARTSVVGIEKGTPREVRLNSPFDYELIVTNLTSNTLENVVVSEQMSPNFKVNSSTPKADAGSGNTQTWSLGSLGPNESKTIKVNGTAGSEGSVTCCATVSYNSLLCSAIPVVSPKLKLVKTGPAEVLKCDDIVYTLEVTNTGTGSISNVKITDPLPAGLAAADGRKTVDFNVGTLAAGQSRKVNITAKADKAGKYDNKATATGDGGMSTDSAVVSTMVRQPVLTIVAECPPALRVGRDATFKFTVKNTGDGNAASTMVSAPIPAGTTFVSADNGGTMGAGKVGWNVGTLKPNDSKTVSMTLKVGAIGSVPASATASANCAAAVTDDCTTSAAGVPDIGVMITDDVGVIALGVNHVYRYEVKNQGQIDLTNVKMVASLDGSVDYVSSTAPIAPKVNGKKLEFNIGTLKAGEKRQFTITVKGNAPGERPIITETNCDQVKTALRADEITNFVEN